MRLYLFTADVNDVMPLFYDAVGREHGCQWNVTQISLFLISAMILADHFVDEYNDLHYHCRCRLSYRRSKLRRRCFKRTFVWAASNMACSYGRWQDKVKCGTRTLRRRSGRWATLDYAMWYWFHSWSSVFHCSIWQNNWKYVTDYYCAVLIWRMEE